jgi:hypothetical protein
MVPALWVLREIEQPTPSCASVREVAAMSYLGDKVEGKPTDVRRRELDRQRNERYGEN